MASPEGLFAALLEAAPTQPFVTYYGDGSHDRAELSARSLANWVAKTYFLLTDELGLGRGNAAYVDLPAHWISLSPLVGCWTAGLEVVTDPSRADVGFVDPERALNAVEIPDVFVIAPDAAVLGLKPDRLPPGMERQDAGCDLLERPFIGRVDRIEQRQDIQRRERRLHLLIHRDQDGPRLLDVLGVDDRRVLRPRPPDHPRGEGGDRKRGDEDQDDQQRA